LPRGKTASHAVQRCAHAAHGQAPHQPRSRRHDVLARTVHQLALIFIPVSLALEHAAVPAPVLFFSAALAIIPLARLIVVAAEHLATCTGDTIGGLPNATLGNAPELIIGAILGNLMLATGVQLVLVYAMIAVLFYLLPVPAGV